MKTKTALEKVLADKLQTRRRLASLPFARKLVILEQLRDRSRLLATQPLRRITKSR